MSFSHGDHSLVFAQGGAPLSPYAYNYSQFDMSAVSGGGGTDYLNLDEYTKKRSMFEKLGVRTGVSYLVGALTLLIHPQFPPTFYT